MVSEHAHQWDWHDDGMGFIGRCSVCGNARLATLEEVTAWYKAARQQLAKAERRQQTLQAALDASLAREHQEDQEQATMLALLSATLAALQAGAGSSGHTLEKLAASIQTILAEHPPEEGRDDDGE
jgi:hypothetical protein